MTPDHPVIQSPRVDSVDPGPDEQTGAVADAAVPQPSMAASIAFWMTLLAAAALYAMVALAPKFAVWNAVRHEYRRNARQLVRLEEDVDYLERVTAALETDPEFVRRLANATGVVETDDGAEMVPVSGHLLFGFDDDRSETLTGEVTSPPLDSVARRLASDIRLRNGLLMCSAAMTIFAFTFLNDAGERFVLWTVRSVRRLVTYPIRRYLRPAPTESVSAPATDDTAAAPPPEDTL